jgi:hypothetical protein
MCAAIVTAACNDSPSGPGSTLRLTNFQATQLGLTHALCNVNFQYLVHDELSFDVVARGVNTNLINATLHNVADDGTETLVGPVAQCTGTLTPCPSPFGPPMNVCLVQSGSVQRIRAIVRVPWTPVRTWRVFLRVTDVNTNVLEAQIERKDGLPTGNTAAIAFLEGRRTGSTTGSYSFIAHSPGIAGRRIVLTREVWANGVRLSTDTRETAETQPGTTGSFGGIIISPDPTELVGLLEERDANGNVIATDRRSTMFQ